jgi:hypothetical protein
MRDKVESARKRQLLALDRRLEELGRRSGEAAESLLAASGRERRSPRRSELEAEVTRLCEERERIQEEDSMELLSEEAIDRHLASIERQIERVFAERDAWHRERLAGRRRRAADNERLERLKDENERLTAELMRCAVLLCRDYRSGEDPRVRRVWQMLRLCGC